MCPIELLEILYNLKYGKKKSTEMKVLTKRADSYENQLILAFKSITFHICTWLPNATVFGNSC